MKNKKIILLGSMFILSVFCTSNVPTKPVSSPVSENLQSQNFSTEGTYKKKIYSYVNVLENYYDIATKNVENPSVDFNTFYDAYYAPESNRDLYAFTLKLAADNDNLEFACAELNISDYESLPPFASSSKDAYYILKSTYDYDVTPSSAFVRKPYGPLCDFTYIQSGDIVYETETIFFNAGHNAIISDRRHESDYGGYVQTIEAVAGGVQFGFVDDVRIAYYKCYILRVMFASKEETNDAIYFAKKQLGKPYSLDINRTNTDINSKKWYCSELVYACYKYAGFDISAYKDSNGEDASLETGVLPITIADSYNTYYVKFVCRHPLGFEIIKKTKNIWTVKISNFPRQDENGNKQKIYYNEKMCFYGDAKDWKNLSNVKELTVEENTNSFTVEIQENWFATSIVVSYVEDGYRFINCADHLNEKDKTLEEHLSILKV